MPTLSASELRDGLSEIMNRVAYGGERIVVSRNDKELAALVSINDLRELERLEEARDLEAVRRSKAEPGENVNWEDLKSESGL